MSDFLIVDPVFVKISEISEIKSYSKDPSRLHIKTQSADIVVKPEINFSDHYLNATLHQAQFCADGFITFTDAYGSAEEVFDQDAIEVEKGNCQDCAEDPDLCTKNH